MESFAATKEYDRLANQIGRTADLFTSGYEAAMIHGVIKQLRPQMCLEIGTFFAGTTRIMAEAIVASGSATRLETIDPYGKKRVPQLLAAWPRELRRVTKFYPFNSMEYFMHLTGRDAPKGADSPFGLIFVDGNHDFEYALFDILRSADQLAPGGVIFVDNLEQDGPKSALLRFLQWNPGWKLFYEGKQWSYDFADLPSPPPPAGQWGALLAPPGIQIAQTVSKFMKRGIPYAPLRALRFNPIAVKGEGQLEVNVSFYSTPIHYDGVGKGMESVRAVTSHTVLGKGHGDIKPIVVDMPETLTLSSKGNNSLVCYEIEVSLRSRTSPGSYLLLDAASPMNLLS